MQSSFIVCGTFYMEINKKSPYHFLRKYISATMTTIGHDIRYVCTIPSILHLCILYNFLIWLCWKDQGICIIVWFFIPSACTDNMDPARLIFKMYTWPFHLHLFPLTASTVFINREDFNKILCVQNLAT